MLSHTLQPQLRKLAHYLCQWTSFNGYRRFDWATRHIQQAQHQRLSKIISEIYNTPVGDHYNLHRGMSIEQFRQNIPLSDYKDWQPFIDKQRSMHEPVLSNSPCDRYQPTSGSTSAIKWIPYTTSFLAELDQALSPWMWDLYNRYPQLKKGRHYWSLSWIPTELRQSAIDNVNDDRALLPLWKRLFMTLIMAVPDTVSHTRTSEESWFKTLCYLANDSSLSLISVWSPTFGLGILEGMQQYRADIVSSLETGQWPAHLNDSQGLQCPQNKRVAALFAQWDGQLSTEFVNNLWPSLALLSAWDTSSSARWAKQLQQQLPLANFQGKGLWATEGVITFPLGNQYPLAINSHFYEFIDTENNQVYLPWELKLNQKVRPVLTTGSGLLRYVMKDLIQVAGFINQCPCFKFLGRIDGTDLVGEKLSTELASTLLEQFASTFIKQGVKPLSLIAVPSASSNDKPYYVLLCQHDNGSNIWSEEMQQFLENFLNKHFHYQLARDLNQLQCSRLVIAENAWNIYHERGQRRGMIAGNLKVEPLLTWDDWIPEEFLQGHFPPSEIAQQAV